MKRKEMEDFEVGPGSLVEGNNLECTQGYIYVHIIGEYGEKKRSSIPIAQENARSPALYARVVCTGTYTTCFHIDTQSYTYPFSIDIEINTQG